MTTTAGQAAPQAEPQPPPQERWRRTLFAARAMRKVVVSTVGAAVTILGIVLLPLPGPGMLVVGLGLGLLSTEYHWPKRLSRWLRREAGIWAGRLRDRRRGRRS